MGLFEMRWVSRGHSTEEGLHYTKKFSTSRLHNTKKFFPSGSLVRIVNLGYIVYIGVIFSFLFIL
jgi:hypothetical protein